MDCVVKIHFMSQQSVQFDFDQRLKDLKHNYLSKLPDKLTNLENMILYLENHPSSDEMLNSLAREIHTLKGTAGCYGYHFVTTVCHQFEDFFLMITTQNMFNAQSADHLLKYIDLLKEYTDSQSKANKIHLGHFQNKLHSIAHSFKTSQNLDKRRRILLIETSKTLTHYYTKHLLGKGNLVSSTSSGYEALGRLLHETFDLIISAYEVEEINGIELFEMTRILENSNKDTPFILITSIPEENLPIKTEKPTAIFHKDGHILESIENWI